MDIILAATSDHQSSELLQAVLGGSYVLFHGNSIRELIEILRDRPVDLVLVDESIENKSVTGILPEILSIKEYLPTIVMCENPKAEHSAAFLTLGAYDVIQKPLEKNELVHRVEKALQYRRLCEKVRLLEESGGKNSSLFARESSASSPKVDLPTSKIIRTRSLETFHKALVRIRDFDGLCNLVVEGMTEAFSVSAAALVLMDGNGEKLSVKASKGQDEELLNSVKFRADEGVFRWLRQNSGILLVGRVSERSSPDKTASILKDTGILRARLCVPLRVRGKLIGYLSLADKVTGNPYDDEDLTSIFSLAEHAAGAIENSLSLHLLQQQKEHLDGIFHYMQCGVVAADKEGIITAFNATAGQLLRMNPKEAIGKHAETLGHACSSILMRTLEHKHLCTRERICPKCGEHRLEVSTSLLKNCDGTRSGAIMLLTDASTLPIDSNEASVADNGEGAAPEKTGLVSEPFFATKDAVGLGSELAIARKTINPHNGSINIESEKGSGTTVRVRIPNPASPKALD